MMLTLSVLMSCSASVTPNDDSPLLFVQTFTSLAPPRDFIPPAELISLVASSHTFWLWMPAWAEGPVRGSIFPILTSDNFLACTVVHDKRASRLTMNTNTICTLVIRLKKYLPIQLSYRSWLYISFSVPHLKQIYSLAPHAI